MPAFLSSPDISSPDLSSAGISSPAISVGGLSTPDFSPPSTNESATKVNPTALAQTLITLFEASPLIPSKLVPQLINSQSYFDPTSYSELIDASIYLISSWPLNLQAQFVAGHPRIGEVSNLSALSAAEQASRKTSPEVLQRLEYLNAAFESVYPGLRYITFVNGRSRAEIAREMEVKLEIHDETPEIESLPVIPRDDPEWEAEVRRAVQDVGKIAHARLFTLASQAQEERKS
ncbi:OHCU decarboxylase-domain-containing protein [Flagelloscypha sp. PMI_526]|nr:OHCU decarboxylase-domain-containing protein [Flagelloscypha sp. PMI_526]